MLVFLDTEFTDFKNRELISIGMAGEDGRREQYLEVQDFDRSKCNSFVQLNVWPNIGCCDGAVVRKAEVRDRLHDWFTTLPRSVMIASDSQYDHDLLANALDGQWPNNLSGWFDLRPLIDTGIFNGAVERYHTETRPWHHALYDAQAHRAGWLAWMDQQRRRKLGK